MSGFINTNVTLASCSPALEYATNNIGHCKVVISVYTNEGVLIGTETMDDINIAGLCSVKQRCEKYEAQLACTRSRVQKCRTRNVISIAPDLVAPSNGYS